jgi:uncharacterized membrane protein YhaH (DUF805 family)
VADDIISIIKGMTTTDGRLSRTPFWWFHGVLFVLVAILGLLKESNAVPEIVISVFALFIFPLFIMSVIVEIKRFHDRDKSGWWVLINLIPCLGFVWFIVECGILPGTKGKNRFGPDPLKRSS